MVKMNIINYPADGENALKSPVRSEYSLPGNFKDVCRRFFSVTCLTLLSVCGGSATTYFVATNGVDTGVGTSTNSPWRTIQKAANTPAPGDTVFVRGGIYNEEVTFNVSGSATGGRITFQSYPGETAIVDGAGLTVPPAAYAAGLFEFTTSSYLVIQGFEIRNYQVNSASLAPAGIDITGAPHDLTFISNRVHNIANLNTTANSQAYGIAVHGTLPQAISNLVFQCNEIYSNILGQSESFSLDGNCNGFDISGNLVHDNNNIGLDFIGFEGVCSDASQDYTRNGACRSNLVWNISDAANPGYPANDYSADGIYCDGGSNVLVELNQVHGCDLGVELASEHQGHATSACVCRDNLIWSNYTTGISIGGYSTSVGRTINCVITHNTLYHNDTLQSGAGEMEFQYAPATNTITHNVFVANSQNLFISDNFTQNTNNTVDWNLYCSPGGTNGSVWMWANQTYTSFAAWLRGTTNDIHSQFADPQFINATNANFHLSITSPAVNAGDPAFQSLTNVTAETDIDRQPRVAGGRTDMGADELNILSATLGIGASVDGQVQLYSLGEPGHPFVWEQSATLSRWLAFFTNNSDGAGQISFTYSAAGGVRFFRSYMER